MSDLHNEYDRRGRRTDLFNPPRGHPQTGPDLTPLKGQIDVLLLAGDIDDGREAVRYGAAAADYLDVRVIMIAGNHEYYNGVFEDVLADMRDEARRHSQVEFLENDIAVLEKDDEPIRVLGCSLWTDYALHGDDIETINRSMFAAEEGLTDHWAIKRDNAGNLFTPQHALVQHQQSVGWLASTLAQDFDGQTIVMTHHGVSSRSVPGHFRGSALSPCFVSNLDEIVKSSRASLWLHGHTHFDVDYQIGQTRVLARQRGYPQENPSFWPLIVKL